MTNRHCTCFGDEIDYECPQHKIMYGLKESPKEINDAAKEIQMKAIQEKFIAATGIKTYGEQDCD